MDEVALGDPELAVIAFEFKNIGFGGDAFDFGGHVIDGDVAGSIALRRGDEVAGALMGDANEIGAAAGLVEGVEALRIGGGVGHFAHAGLHVDEDYGIACGGFAGGLVDDGAGYSGGLRQGGGKKECGR